MFLFSGIWLDEKDCRGHRQSFCVCVKNVSVFFLTVDGAACGHRDGYAAFLLAKKIC